MARVFVSAAKHLLFCSIFILAAAAKPVFKLFQLEYGQPKHDVCVAIMLVLNFVLPYLFSFVLGHLIERGKGFYRSTLFMPATLSLAVASILFLWIYNPLAGPLSIVLSWFYLHHHRLEGFRLQPDCNAGRHAGSAERND